MRRLLLILFVTGSNGISSANIDAGTDSLTGPETVAKAYQEMHYNHVITMVTRELDLNPSQDKEDIQVYLKYLALSQFAVGDIPAASQSMKALLIVNPTFSFQSTEISPKVMDLFDDIRSGRRNLPQEEGVPSTSIVVMKDLRSNNILAGIIWPGRGHIRQGQARGYIYSLVFGSALTLSAYYSIVTKQRRDTYLRSYSPGDLQTAYGRYNSSYKIRNNIFLTGLTCYLISIVDLYLTTAP